MIFNMVGFGEVQKVRVLDANYPADISMVESDDGTALFTVAFIDDGNIDSCTYQWYVNGEAVPGATEMTYIQSGLTTVADYSVYCEVTNRAATVRSRIAKLSVQSSQPVFTYSGNFELIKDGDYNWRIKLKTSGVLRFSHLGNCDGLDVFCVGGGGGGSGYQYNNASGSGGGGGYTKTYKSIPVEVDTDYSVVIGGGGAPKYSAVSGDGGMSYFAITSYSANGGYGAGRGVSGNKPNRYYGGDGGSGGGGNGVTVDGAPLSSIQGGSDGGNGGTRTTSGIGQGVTTREFGETNGALYAGGGAACKVLTTDQNVTGADGGGGGILASIGQNGGTNTGGGGGGGGANVSRDTCGGAGGSGIIVIRNHR